MLCALQLPVSGILHIEKKNADALMQKWHDDFPLLFQAHCLWLYAVVIANEFKINNQSTDTHTVSERERKTAASNEHDDDGFLPERMIYREISPWVNWIERRVGAQRTYTYALSRLRSFGHPSMQQMNILCGIHAIHDEYVSVTAKYAELLCCVRWWEQSVQNGKWKD